MIYKSRGLCKSGREVAKGPAAGVFHWSLEWVILARDFQTNFKSCKLQVSELSAFLIVIFIKWFVGWTWLAKIRKQMTAVSSKQFSCVSKSTVMLLLPKCDFLYQYFKCVQDRIIETHVTLLYISQTKNCVSLKKIAHTTEDLFMEHGPFWDLSAG